MNATRAASGTRGSGSLSPGELAQASVMAALCAATAIISIVVPFAGALALLGTVPMGLLAYRYRFRALVAATVAAGLIAFLIAGLGGLMTVANNAYIGGLTGVIKRRGRGVPTVLVVSCIAGAVFNVVAVGALAVLSRLRQLIFDTITADTDGIAAVLTSIGRFASAHPFPLSTRIGPALEATGRGLQWFVGQVLHYWPLLLFANGLVSLVVVSLIGWWALSRVLDRMSGIPDVHKLDAPLDAAPVGPIGPVPVRLDKVSFRYPHADRDALRPVSLDVQAGEHLAITGTNGSGKTTLMLVLAGREPTSGTIERPGSVGLGRLGGTAVVMQHPESQVLGTRVADDVVWGLPPRTPVDVDELLAEVGLDGQADRDTGSLSGGELQRLAVAAALAREPALLIADEVTSMVDQQGRDALLGVLSGLKNRHRTSLIHITHYNNEAESADHTINLSESGDNTGMAETYAIPSATPAMGHESGPPVLEVAGVGHQYDSGTPWAKTALREVSFTVQQGDGLLIHGGNGSGKSTLAWILAGLTVPTTGACLLDGRPTYEQVGAAALSFQAARLQLMRSRVDSEVASAAGFSPKDHDRVATALAVVGLDSGLAKRRIDQLSGGQMRRVVLAGLLARSPRALILDEPLAGLDAVTQSGLLQLLEDLRREQGLTVVVMSHDDTGMDELCPHALDLRDGILQAVSTTAGGLS
jgi:energy-coupling factor transport system ATP-binding protein